MSMGIAASSAATKTVDQSKASSATTKALTFYFAGSLFTGRELCGNAHLAEAIHRLSEGRYQAVMPQDTEFRDFSSQGIRDDDLRQVFKTALGIFQLDGTELDSGTVVEFMTAKMADVPALLLRTDFRSAGDHVQDPWNLMVSNYPRTEILVLNSMELYKKGLNGNGSPSAKQSVEAAACMTDTIAKQVIVKLDALMKQPSIMPKDVQETVFKWLAHFPGFKRGVDEMEKFTAEVLKAKQVAGLL